MTTNRQKVLDYLVRFPGKDDDEIARDLGFSQRQTVNIICRQAAAEGLLKRSPGPRGKIVNTLIKSGARPSATRGPLARQDLDEPAIPTKRRGGLTATHLLSGGFRRTGRWVLDLGALATDRAMPAAPGVYAFARGEEVLYVGVATMGLKRRLYFYAKPGVSQHTSVRLNTALRTELAEGRTIEILTAEPPDFSWNGLKVNGCVGLELGLIQEFGPPWNRRG